MRKKFSIKDGHFMRQAGIALVAGSAVLGVLALVSPKEEEPVVIAPTAPIAVQPNVFEEITVAGKAAIVYDLRTGEVLFAKNAEAQLPLASLTKLLTVYAAATTLGDTAPVVMTETALAEEGESGFMLGESFAFKDLARLVLVSSSNDAATAITEAAEREKGVGKTALMASAAKAAHLSQTYATNGTGLDIDLSTSGGYGSAHDVALLAGALLEEAPYIAEATTERSITISSTAGVAHTLSNTNQDVIHVPGVRLSKTGFTDLAGGNLVVVFDAGIDHPVAAVVLGSTRESRFTDVSRLIDATHAYFAGLSPS